MEQFANLVTCRPLSCSNTLRGQSVGYGSGFESHQAPKTKIKMAKIVCPTCKGEGVITIPITKGVNLLREESVLCSECEGKGEVDGEINEPLFEFFEQHHNHHVMMALDQAIRFKFPNIQNLSIGLNTENITVATFDVGEYSKEEVEDFIKELTTQNQFNHSRS